MTARRTIPIAVAEGRGDCAGAESFALLVLGDSMAPEFVEGEVIVVEPDGLASDGSFVVAQVDGEWTMRKLVADGGRLEACGRSIPPTPSHPRRPVAGARRRDPEEPPRQSPRTQALH